MIKQVDNKLKLCRVNSCTKITSILVGTDIACERILIQIKFVCLYEFGKFFPF